MTLEELVKAIESLTVAELAELVKMLEERFGVSAAAPVMAAMPVAAAAAAQQRSRERHIRSRFML